MWLILAALAAIISSVIWYVKAPEDKYQIGLLSLIYWGSTIMWLADHIMVYLTEGGDFFDTSLDGTLLGVSVLIIGLFAWMIVLFVTDPKGLLKRLWNN